MCVLWVIEYADYWTPTMVPNIRSVLWAVTLWTRPNTCLMSTVELICYCGWLCRRWQYRVTLLQSALNSLLIRFSCSVSGWHCALPRWIFQWSLLLLWSYYRSYTQGERRRNRSLQLSDSRSDDRPVYTPYYLLFVLWIVRQRFYIALPHDDVHCFISVGSFLYFWLVL